MKTLEELKNVINNRKKITLYHGSRDGISGKIRPINHKRETGQCDFGNGFYMGTDERQAESLICDKRSRNPIVYTLEVDFSVIPEDKILILDDEDWLYTVLAFRSDEDNKLFEQYKEQADQYDIVIGYIADDKMQMVMTEFMENTITDKALFECLKSLNYGYQIAAKTEKACNCIKITDEHSLFGQSRANAQAYAERLRKENTEKISSIRIKYKSEGRFLAEIEEEKEEYGEER